MSETAYPSAAGMRLVRIISSIAVATVCAGCALYSEPSEVTAMRTQIPYRDATAIADAVESEAIFVAAAVPDRDTQIRLLSEPLPDRFLPVLITITNSGDKRIIFDRVAISSGGFTHPAVPVTDVIRSLQGHFWLTMRMFFLPEACIWEAMNEKQRRDEAVNIAVYEKLLRPSIIEPRTTVAGFAFFDGHRTGQDAAELTVTLQKLDRISFVSVSVPVTRFAEP